MADGKKLLTDNRKARFSYVIEDTVEAGIILTGAEAKSAKMGHVNLTGAYALFKNNEAWLLNCHISAYPFDSMPNLHEPTRTRKLLLSKSEIAKLITRISSKGYTMVPLEVYAKKSRVKILLGLAKGKKAPDKREDIKKRDLDREMRGKYKYR